MSQGRGSSLSMALIGIAGLVIAGYCLYTGEAVVRNEQRRSSYDRSWWTVTRQEDPTTFFVEVAIAGVGGAGLLVVALRRMWEGDDR
jgi:hypothetical protein